MAHEANYDDAMRCPLSSSSLPLAVPLKNPPDNGTGCVDCKKAHYEMPPDGGALGP